MMEAEIGFKTREVKSCQIEHIEWWVNQWIHCRLDSEYQRVGSQGQLKVFALRTGNVDLPFIV